jgi:hypothetical protein
MYKDNNQNRVIGIWTEKVTGYSGQVTAKKEMTTNRVKVEL